MRNATGQLAAGGAQLGIALGSQSRCGASCWQAGGQLSWRSVLCTVSAQQAQRAHVLVQCCREGLEPADRGRMGGAAAPA